MQEVEEKTGTAERKDGRDRRAGRAVARDEQIIEYRY